MFLSIVKEFEALQNRRAADPYGGWAAAVQKLREQWQGGIAVRPEELASFVEPLPAVQQAAAVQDLIAEHLRLAWSSALGPPLEHYAAALGERFPALACSSEWPADLIEDEFLARYAIPFGDAPSPEVYRRRLPGRRDLAEMLGQRQLAGGRYTVLGEIGRGAMGVVFEAYDRRLQRRVAIKRPRSERTDLFHRFADEARLTAGLDHPAIVTVYESGRDRGQPYFVMRRATGISMSESIQRYHGNRSGGRRDEQALSLIRLLQAYTTICDAIEYSHVQGVLHRDLKPSNILIGEHGEVSILDWGLAARIPWGSEIVEQASPTENSSASNSEGERLVGTPQYMPPEQTAGLSSTRSDVFGLGAILYEILTGGPPYAWPAGSRRSDWQQIVRAARITSPRELVPKAPRDLEAICMTAMAACPQARYASASELAKDVRRFLARQPVVARSRHDLGRRWWNWR